MAKKVNREETWYQIQVKRREFIEQNQRILPISSLVKILGISRSYYYKFRNNSANLDKDSILKNYILECHEKYKGIYGKLRIKAWLEKTYSIVLNHKKVYRLMKELGIKSIIRKKRQSRTYKTPEIVRENILKRNFKASNPNEKWSIDVSYIPSKSIKFHYLCAIKDLYNNKIVGYSLSKFQDLEQVLTTVKETIKDKKLSNLVIHSDQGFQFTHKSYITLLESQGIKVSHSRRGKCLDNAPIECFFGHLKSELPYLYSLKTDEEILNAIRSYIKFYNEERIQVKLKGCSPNEFGNTA